MCFFCNVNLLVSLHGIYKDLTMNFVQLTQQIKQTHDALQSYAAKTINVGLTVQNDIIITI
jgi:hypothetical protein